MRLGRVSDADCWGTGARRVRRTRDHAARRTMGETDHAGGQHRVPLRRERLGAVRLGYADIADQHRGTVRKDAAQPASWRSFPQWVSVWHLAASSLLGAATRKPLVFLAKPPPPAVTLRLTHRASTCTISRPSQRPCAHSQKACVRRPLQSQLMCVGKCP